MALIALANIWRKVGCEVKSDERQLIGNVESKRTVKILIVEDEPGVAMTMRFILGRANCEAQIAATKEMAIKMAESGNFDLITLDINLRGDNGFEICRDLKQNPFLRNTPIIIISGLCSLEDQQRGLEVGAADFITKPFDSAEFAPRILSHIATEECPDRSSK